MAVMNAVSARRFCLSSRCKTSSPTGPVRMRPDRIVPLIIAVALFMENMDSTVIATSLPAIAADIGTNPLALKLAVTSYLLSLAVFIPASGWTADRFGARTVFRAAIARLHARLDRLRAVAVRSRGFVIARIVQGMGGAMMTPVGRLVLVRTHRQARAGQRHGLGDHPGADRPDASARRSAASSPPTPPGTGSSSSTCRSACSASCWRRATSRTCGPRSRSASTLLGMVLAGIGFAGLAFGLSVAGSIFLPLAIVAALIGGGAIFFAAYLAPCAAHADPVLDLSLFRIPTFRASVIGGFVFRLGIGALPFLLPLMLQVGFGMTPFQSGPDHVHLGRRRADDEDRRRAHAAPLRLPHDPARQRADQRGLRRGLRASSPPRRRSAS